MPNPYATAILTKQKLRRSLGRQAVVFVPRRFGKAEAIRQIASEAAASGLSVHVARPPAPRKPGA